MNRARRGQLDPGRFAARLAPLCRRLRGAIARSLRRPGSPLARAIVCQAQAGGRAGGDAPPAHWADALAQTITFGLLMGRVEGDGGPFSVQAARRTLDGDDSVLGRSLALLADSQVRAEIAAPIAMLEQAMAAVPPPALGREDPWLHFYEDFLAVYAPQLRRSAGAYYTPIEVVHAQIRLIDDLLIHRLGKAMGFADPGVATVDPAAGTGTYLLGVIEHALGRVEAERGAGAVAGQATVLANHLHGFELMAGPCAVAELRASRALRDRGAKLPADGMHVHLADTLESPSAQPLPLLPRVARASAKAPRAERDAPVVVCLGNPPYDRHEASGGSRVRAGGWVRRGRDGRGEGAILRDFLDPATTAGHGVRVHNLYNLYVYFWRWALWRVFEQGPASGPGIVSLVTASSYLDGDAFCGMREHLRRVCDEIWILDLGGEGRGTRANDNVFPIQTPVAIAVAFRSAEPRAEQPAAVHYAKTAGTRDAKLAALEAVTGLGSVAWQDCPSDWRAPFRPAGKGRYFDWPLLDELMPWRQSGMKAGRTWVISPDEETLRLCWRTLLDAEPADRKRLLKDSPTGRKSHEGAAQLPPSEARLPPIAELARQTPSPRIVRLAYRSFDRQFVLADARLLDRPSPGLWRSHGPGQLYLTSLFSQPLGAGPALTASAEIPDLDHFRGSYGAKAAIPLYLDAEGRRPNLHPRLLATLGRLFERALKPEDVVAYVYGVLASEAFTLRYAEELEARELRVPITRNAALFEQVRAVGARLLWLHTFGERCVPRGRRRGRVPRGEARCTRPVPGDPEGYPDSFDYAAATRTLRVGQARFAPVTPEVYRFEVSGLKAVPSWLKYRMKRGSGRKSSPLDDLRPRRWTGQFTRELLELLWVLEGTVSGSAAQARLLDKVVAGPCLRADFQGT